MDVLNCSLRFRPVRIGWCLRQKDWASYQKILELNFILAGGQFNPLIPIDDEREALELIRAFRVDLLLSVSEDGGIQSFIAKFPYLTPPGLCRGFWEELKGCKIPRFADISHFINKHFGQAHKNSPDYRLLCYDWEPNDPLAYVLLATLGKLPQSSPKEIDYFALLGKGVSVESKALTLSDSFPVPVQDSHVLVPSFFCRSGVKQHYRYSTLPQHAGLYVGQANNFQDLVNFWNLKAANLSVAFYDPAHTERLHKTKENWLFFFPPYCKETIPSPPSIKLWSQTLDILDESEKWEIPANRCKIDSVFWNGSNIHVPYMYFSEHRAVGIQTTRSSGCPSISIQRSPFPFEDHTALQSQQVVVAVQPQTLNLIDYATTLQLPFIPELNPYYDQSCHFGVALDCTRIEPDGIGFIQEIHQQELSFQPASTDELICKLFALYKIEARVSDVGRLTQRLILQMGGLQSCRIFKFSGVRSLINKFTSFDYFNWESATKIIFKSKESFEKDSEIHFEGKKIKTSDEVFRILLKKNIFSAGLQLNCPNCLLDFWAPINRLSSELACEHCQFTFNVLPYLHQFGKWVFRPSSLFITRDKQKGSVSVMLTLQQLELSLGWGKMPYGTSMNFHKKDPGKFACESDFTIILPSLNFEGKIEVVIAECKSDGGEITAGDVEKLGTLAAVLPQDQFCVYIVFSKLTRFSQEELNRIAVLNTQSTRVIIFTTKDLEALYPYQELLQEHKQLARPGSLQSMASITDTFILANRSSGYPKT